MLCNLSLAFLSPSKTRLDIGDPRSVICTSSPVMLWSSPSEPVSSDMMLGSEHSSLRLLPLMSCCIAVSMVLVVDLF